MEKEEKHIDELIITYLTKGLDKDAFSKLKNWISTSPENEKYFMQQQEIWFSAINKNEEVLYNKEKAFLKFKHRIKNQSIGGKINKKRYNFNQLYRYAAIIPLLCMISYFSYWKGETNVKEAFSEIIVESPLGSRTKLYLPDGTLVWLNAGSRLAYSQGFGMDDRNIQLSGEGYFEVKRNERIPFEIKTKDLQVKVLGTKFNFRNYPEDTEAIVSLVKGKVALNNLLKNEKEVILYPNERVILNKKNCQMQIESVNASNALEWTNGYLFFDEELLPDILKKLERSYNVKIHIANDSLKAYRFYGNFIRREQSIQEILEVLSLTQKIHYTIKEHNITLY
jgi:ferric-dicitrate binding protein FerR (iron transport regulator)